MEVVEFIIVLLIALAIASIFFYGLGRRGPWGAFWVFLLILFLAAWVGRLWIAPAGPLVWGYGWFPVIFWVLMVALIIGVVIPEEEETEVDYEPETRTRVTESDRGVAAAFGLFFWLLLLVLIVAIIAGLLR